MYRELFKLSKSIGIKLWFICTIIIVFIFSFFYYSKLNTQTDFWTHPVVDYSNISEIDNLIELTIIEISELDINDDDYVYSKKILEETITIYRYLKSNEIQYDEIAEPTSFNAFIDDKIQFFTGLTFLILTSMMVFIIILSSIINNIEHSTGISKFLFGQGESRKKIFKHKLMVYLLIISISIVFLICIMLILTIPYEINYNYILIFNQGDVVLLSVNKYIIYMIISLLFVVFINSLIGFLFSIMFENVFISIVTSVFYFFILSGISLSLESKFINAFSQFPLYIFDLDISIEYFIIINIIKVSFIIIAYYFCITRYIKKDILNQ